MIDKKKIAVSAGSSILQTIVAAITTLILFKLILVTIGSEMLGIWSLVLAVSSMVQVANLGLSGSIVKNVADYDAVGDKANMSVVIQTAAISIGLFTLVLILGAYPFAKAYLAYVIDASLFPLAEQILPIALAAFLLMMVGGIYLGALFGCQRIMERNVIMMADSIVYLLLCVVVMPSYGLLGLVYARLAQNVITLLIAVIVLKRHVPQLPVLPLHWSRTHFKEMFGYATNFQIISLLVMLADPITKGFLGKYGNLSMVGYYEVANRMVQIFRSLLVNANQVLVPTFARLEKLDSGKISSTYIASYQIIYYLALPGFCLLAVSAPLISDVLIGHDEPFFIWTTLVLCAGWLINTLAVPAYFTAIGTGNMKANVVSHVAMTTINLVLTIALGQIWGGIGVVLAWSSALTIGGVILNIMHARAHRISVLDFFPEASRLLTALSLLCLVIVYGVWGYMPEIEVNLPNDGALAIDWVNILSSSAMIITFVAIAGVPMWTHPVRRKLWGLISSGRAAAAQ